MYRHRFERIVARTLRGLPRGLRDYLDNVAIVVADEPGPDQLQQAGLNEGETLFGLYEGIPLTARPFDYGMVLPDKITIFQGPIERSARSDQQIAREIRTTVIHELAHHFGISDERLRELKRY